MVTLSLESIPYQYPQQDTDKQTYQRTIAITHIKGDPLKPSLLWLNGYRSNQQSEKVKYLRKWAEKNGHEMFSFDYSGLGESGGDFARGNLTLWLEEAVAVARLITNKKKEIIIAGSSMGGWLALLLEKRLREEGSIAPKGLLLIAPAVDYTEHILLNRLTSKEKKTLRERGYIVLPSPYEESYIVYWHYLEDAKKHCYLPLKEIFQCPVTIVHGTEDEAIPFSWGERFYRVCRREDTRFIAVEGGDHRLSAHKDLVVLEKALKELIK